MQMICKFESWEYSFYLFSLECSVFGLELSSLEITGSMESRVLSISTNLINLT